MLWRTYSHFLNLVAVVSGAPEAHYVLSEATQTTFQQPFVATEGCLDGEIQL